jgi:predicted nucleic acid-binding protein
MSAFFDTKILVYAQQAGGKADPPLALTLDLHTAARALAEDHRLSFYDALIVASAIEAGCDIVYSEDMQHGRKFGSLTIVNPFLESAP